MDMKGTKAVLRLFWPQVDDHLIRQLAILYYPKHISSEINLN